MSAMTPSAMSALTMTSREIADLVEQRHDNVKRTIETLGAKAVVTLPQIEEVPNTGPGPKTVGIYRLDKRDSLIVVAQLCPEFTARIVDRWQELENQVKAATTPGLPNFEDPAAAAIAWAEQFRAKQALAVENAAQAERLAIAAPKAAALDLISAGDDAVTIREAAKILSVKEDRLTSWLHANSWVYRLNGRWVGYQRLIESGCLKFKEARYTDQKTGQTVHQPYCHITPKGMTKLAAVFAAVPA